MTEPHHNPPPQPLGYQTPGVPRSFAPELSAGTLVFRFFAGFFIGVALSAIVWIAGWKPLTQHNGGNGMIVAILFVPGVKFVAGIVFLCLRGWRLLGAGILVSIAIGALIFFGVCTINL